jgi:hypothetical protein
MTPAHGNGARDGWAPFDVQWPALHTDTASLMQNTTIDGEHD